MKKELCAIILLLALSIGAAVNICRAETLTGQLKSELMLSERCALRGDTAAACEHINNAISLWNSADSYTHVFITHSEVDAAADALYSAAGVLCADSDEQEIKAAFECAVYHLDSINQMEKPRLGSIF